MQSRTESQYQGLHTGVRLDDISHVESRSRVNRCPSDDDFRTAQTFGGTELTS